MIIIKDSSGNVIKEIEADISKNLLEQLAAEGIDIPAACYTGICWACMCEVESGAEHIEKNFSWEEWFPTDETEVMTCIAGLKDIKGDIVLKTIY